MMCLTHAIRLESDWGSESDEDCADDGYGSDEPLAEIPNEDLDGEPCF